MRIRPLISAALGLLTTLSLSFVLETRASHAAPTAIIRGHAKYYSPGMFQTVARNRGIKLRSDVSGYAAVPNCNHIGKVIKARINSRDTETYQVVDCSAPADRARHIRDGLVIEVDYSSAVRNQFANQGRAPASVYYP
ncbi:MAG: hypothetical protein ABI670_09425 [Chloroflexota bacterium]